MVQPRRFSLAVIAIAATLAVAPTGCGDSATGGLHDDGSGFEARVDVRSGPSGENPSGTAWMDGLGDFAPRWDVNVTCLSVTGKTAVIGFSGDVNEIYGWGERYPVAGLIRIVDGGGPNSSQDSLEWADVRGPLDGDRIPGPTACSEYPSTFPGRHGPGVNQQGDLVVTDLQPTPTSKAVQGGLR
jgi:hypothetical protein